ncbi:hypothetical protein CcaverHIS002_0107530 [Cutaneotrichosporon cavernicola]|uniref:Uncharacterized protein n=1 Tax=Cutaneotrichosporon cavernicola TaxID=279322 RepID=A0AA48I537_9TREE|nr:uncharacterized protein CcaverHIS019_0107480 [Cutaneotrichosporon cavernicola]BEI80224.1 hypothetical protein CcaverHIS002_0107530 [Cutaneotrichosporon cavernicola]BEI88030.1 hypothetical protein CcaverHIS019_0107480 [Cutaneotrichosporon cavernicola]BEI95803.1 hypothetical protein CcaverHIS631_0107520 [Cutaneotrichosporon cavernicola]BEJ03576.1 hypothetical protein CcaverHIS641_0107510 [Cutaneotrichosporon cavernicola]
MPRPGQKRNRTLAALAVQDATNQGVPQDEAGMEVDIEVDLDDEDDDADAIKPGTKTGQALPVAVIPDDFAGEPEDGATYLALVNRANNSLPFYKRVDVPEHLRPTTPAPAPPISTTGRHPALPRQSWQVLFGTHLAAYRDHLAASWPETLPYPADYPPLPSAGDMVGWLGYINGAGVEMDEEEAMNAEPVLTPREPRISVLQRLDSNTVVRVLKHLNRATKTALQQLEEDGTEGDPFPPAHARWAFALLAILDRQLGGDDTAVLRDFARTLASVAAWRWGEAAKRGELEPVPVKVGFYGQGGEEGAPVLGELNGPGRVGYAVGARWKAVRDARARSEATPRPETTEAGHMDGLDECLARCWMCAHAVAAGWAQWDLLDDFEDAFRGVPRE